MAFDKESKRKLLPLISAERFIKINLLIYIYYFSSEIFCYAKMENFFQKLISKNLHSDIMDFHLQQICSCEAMGKGVCITRVGIGRNYIACKIVRC